jgi:hypothetical protein
MFAKKAQSLNYSGGFGLRRNAAAVRPNNGNRTNDNRTNDNRPVRLAAPRRQKRRPVLFCRWKQTATGRLECHWESGVHGAGAADEGISRHVRRCATGDLVWRAAA